MRPSRPFFLQFQIFLRLLSDIIDLPPDLACVASPADNLIYGYMQTNLYKEAHPVVSRA